MMIGMMGRGRKRVAFENMLRLARARGVPVLDSFGGDEGAHDDGT
jgi:hypothetical protein